MMSDLGVVCIKWGLKPSLTVEIVKKGLSVEDSADIVVEKLKNGENVSNYIYSALCNGNYSIDEVKDALLKIASDEVMGLREAFDYAGGR